MITKIIGISYNGYLSNGYPDSPPTPLVNPTKKEAIAYAKSLTPNKLTVDDFWFQPETGHWELEFKETLYAEVTRDRPFTLADIAEDEEVNKSPVLADKGCLNLMFFARVKPPSNKSK